MAGFSVPQFQFIYQGAPASGGSLYVYQTGTTTPVTCYSDGALTTPIANPITLDSNGQAKFYTTGAVSLRLDGYTSGGTLIQSIDPVYPVGVTAAALPDNSVTDDMLAQANGYTLLGNNAGTLGNKGDISLTAAMSMLAVGITPPQGRLSLNGLAVMTGDVTAATAVYYNPYTGYSVPVYNGTIFQTLLINAGISMALDSTNTDTGYQQSEKLFDLFIYNSGNSPVLATGPAWSSSATRGTGAGTTELQQLNGIWVNKNLITLRTGAATGDTIAVAANQATYVGTMYATADGQTGMSCQPAAASGGTNNILGLWNAYNRVGISAVCVDSASSWTYATNFYRNADNSASNRISWVDGLQLSAVHARYGDFTTGNTGSIPAISIGLNSTAASGSVGGGPQSVDNAYASSFLEAYPQLGLNYVQAVESSLGGESVTFYGNPYHVLSLQIEM